MAFNGDQPDRWNRKTARSEAMYNRSFMRIAPKDYRATRLQTIENTEARRLDRDVRDFSARHSPRESDTIDIMNGLAEGGMGERLPPGKLIAGNRLTPGGRA